jgi:hypothetical protein
MTLSKVNLFSAIAELVQMLKDLGAEDSTLIYVLSQYGFTKEQIKEWYGIGE